MIDVDGADKRGRRYAVAIVAHIGGCGMSGTLCRGRTTAGAVTIDASTHHDLAMIDNKIDKASRRNQMAVFTQIRGSRMRGRFAHGIGGARIVTVNATGGDIGMIHRNHHIGQERCRWHAMAVITFIRSNRVCRPFADGYATANMTFNASAGFYLTMVNRIGRKRRWRNGMTMFTEITGLRMGARLANRNRRSCGMTFRTT